MAKPEGLIISVLVFASLFVHVVGCSREPAEPGTGGKRKPVAEATAKPGDDLGKAGSNHEYILAPGATEELAFSLRLKPWTEHYKGIKDGRIEFDPSQVKLVQRRDHWKGAGATKELVSLKVVPVEKEDAGWGLDISEVMAENPNARLISIGGRAPTKAQYQFAVVDNQKAILHRLDRMTQPPRIAELTRQEMDEKLGDNFAALLVTGNNKRYELPLQRIALRKVSYFARLKFRVTMPRGQETNRGCESWHRLTVDGREAGVFGLKFTFDPKGDKVYHVFGPDEQPEKKQPEIR